MIYGYKYEPLINRVPTWIDRRYQIQGFDTDNLYPQRAKETRDRSYTLKSACDRYSEFINGEGFTNPLFAGMTVNRKGHTANDWLDHLAKSLSWANGVFIHVGYNLNYKVNSTKIIDFEFNRFGIPDNEGDFYCIKYCNNWENNPYKNPTSVMEIVDYNVFNPDPEVVKAEIEMAGGILNYKGQIFYWTPEEGQYPKATFDTVFDQAQTQAHIGTFDLSMEQNGFRGGHAMIVPKMESDPERRAFDEKLQDFTTVGGGAGSVLVMEQTGGEPIDASKIIVPLQMQNTDGLHVNVDKRVRNAIRTAFGMPPEIIGELPENGMFNKQQIEDAYIYYNSLTRNTRNIAQRIAKKIFTHWQAPVTDDYSIIPQKYMIETQSLGTNG